MGIGCEGGILHVGKQDGEEVIDRHAIIKGEAVERIVSVLISTHTEVHVIHVVLSIIAIDIKGMATDAGRVARHVKGAIDQGTASNQLRLDQFAPLFLGVVDGTIVKVQLLNHVGITITKGAEGQHDFLALCTTPIQTIVHSLGLAHIAHEPTDGVNLRIGNLVDTT